MFEKYSDGDIVVAHNLQQRKSSFFELQTYLSRTKKHAQPLPHEIQGQFRTVSVR